MIWFSQNIDYLFGKNILYIPTLSNLENARKISKYSYLKKGVFLKKILSTISGTADFTFEVGNSRFVKNTSFSEKICHDL